MATTATGAMDSRRLHAQRAPRDFPGDSMTSAELLAVLSTPAAWGYHPGGEPATEPAALAALLLVARGHPGAAAPLTWLVECQQPDGSLGPSASQTQPCWPTSLAVLAWQRALETLDARHLRKPIERGVLWLLSAAGKPEPRTQEQQHDTTLIGWPWVDGTHSWVEPTALALLALRATGHAAHLRAREASRLLLDRQLPHGGWNYGNTIVLGNTLRPHVQPSGLALLALAGSGEAGGRMQRSIDWLERSLGPQTTAASLAWALLGLTAVALRPVAAAELLSSAHQRTQRFSQAPLRPVLLELAALGPAAPLIIGSAG